MASGNGNRFPRKVKVLSKQREKGRCSTLIVEYDAAVKKEQRAAWTN